MTIKNENTINGFETIPTLPHGMSFLAQRGLISRVEQNCSHDGLPTATKSMKRIGGEPKEIKSVTSIEGFGDMAFATLAVLVASQKQGKLLRVNDAKNNKLTNAEEICKRNMHVIEQYYMGKQDGGGTNNQNGIVDYDLAYCDELAHDDLQQIPQEIFGYDVKGRNRSKYPFRKYTTRRSKYNGN
jgi:hypothetical protein